MERETTSLDKLKQTKRNMSQAHLGCCDATQHESTIAIGKVFKRRPSFYLLFITVIAKPRTNRVEAIFDPHQHPKISGFLGLPWTSKMHGSSEPQVQPSPCFRNHRDKDGIGCRK